jgi:hypothetical protein
MRITDGDGNDRVADFTSRPFASRISALPSKTSKIARRTLQTFRGS